MQLNSIERECTLSKFRRQAYTLIAYTPSSWNEFCLLPKFECCVSFLFSNLFFSRKISWLLISWLKYNCLLCILIFLEHSIQITCWHFILVLRLSDICICICIICIYNQIVFIICKTTILIELPKISINLNSLKRFLHYIIIYSMTKRRFYSKFVIKLPSMIRYARYL